MRKTSVLAFWALVLPVSVVVAQPKPESAPGAEASIDERLKIERIDKHVLRGKTPSVDDLATLARDYKVTQLVSLLNEDEADPALAAAAAAANLEFDRSPILLTRRAAPELARVNRSVALDVVDLLKKSGDKVTYVFCPSGVNRVGFIDFAYRVKVNGDSFAEGYRIQIERGFKGGHMPGYVVDMKLLVSGEDRLPTVTLAPINNRQLTSPGETISVGGLDLNVKQLGEGPPLYCLHGGPGESHMLLRPFFDPFQRNHRVVYYDQRGCGLSEGPQFNEAYTLLRLVKELEGLREALGHEKITLLAHSTGGVLAMEYALKHPERVKKMVLVSTWASGEEFMPNANLAITLLRKPDFEAFMELQRTVYQQRRTMNNPEMTDAARMFAPYSFYGEMDKNAFLDWARRCEVSAIVNVAMSREVFRHIELRPQLIKLKSIPTLVIAGAFDVIAAPEIVKSVADHIPGARFEIFERSGHYCFAEENDRFVRRVGAFLAE